MGGCTSAAVTPQNDDVNKDNHANSDREPHTPDSAPNAPASPKQQSPQVPQEDENDAPKGDAERSVTDSKNSTARAGQSRDFEAEEEVDEGLLTLGYESAYMTIYHSSGGYVYALEDLSSSDEEEDGAQEDDPGVHVQENKLFVSKADTRLARVVEFAAVEPGSILTGADIRYNIGAYDSTPGWNSTSAETVCVPWLSPFFVHLAQELLEGRLESVAKLGVSEEADPTAMPKVLEDLSALEGQDEQQPVAGAFGSVSVMTWDERRVFVKQQQVSRQFCVEIATLAASSDAVLPTPRLLALHLDGDKATTVMALSEGEAADAFFHVDRQQPLQTKMRAAMMFAWALKCCHQQHVLHNDVALKNFMTNGDNVFEIVDFGLSMVLAADHDEAPYLHNLAPIYQSSPEMIKDRTVSGASDMWQFGWMLHDLMVGSDGDGLLPRFLREQIVPTFGDKSKFLEAVRTLRPTEVDYPAEVFELVLRCLDVDPSKRATPDDVIRCTGKLAGEDVLAEILLESLSTPEAALRIHSRDDVPKVLPHPRELLKEGVTKTVLEAIKGNKKNVAVDEYTQIGAGPVRALFSSLQVESFGGFSNAVGASGLRQLAQFMHSSRELREVWFESCEIGDDNFALLADALAQPRGSAAPIQSVNIIYGRIGEASGEALARAFKVPDSVASTCLLSLSLPKNTDAGGPVIKALSEIEHDVAIESLYLSDNSLTLGDATHVAALVRRKHPHLTNLGLADNRPISAKGGQIIAEAVRDNPLIAKVSLDPLPAFGAAIELQDNPERAKQVFDQDPHASTVVLDYARTQGDLVMAAEAVRRCTHMERLQFKSAAAPNEDLGLLETVAVDVAAAWAADTEGSLREVVFDFTHIGGAGAAALAAALVTKLDQGKTDLFLSLVRCGVSDSELLAALEPLRERDGFKIQVAKDELKEELKDMLGERVEFW